MISVAQAVVRKWEDWLKIVTCIVVGPRRSADKVVRSIAG